MYVLFTPWRIVRNIDSVGMHACMHEYTLKYTVSYSSYILLYMVNQNQHCYGMLDGPQLIKNTLKFDTSCSYQSPIQVTNYAPSMTFHT